MKKGQNFGLRVSVLEARGLKSFATFIQYDSTKVMPVENAGQVTIQDGGFLSQDGSQVTCLANLKDGNQGQIVVGCARMGAVGGLDGEGGICVLRFQAVGEGETQIICVEAETKLFDSAGGPLPFRLENVEFTIIPETMATIKLEIIA